MEYPFILPEGTTIGVGKDGKTRGLTATHEFVPGEIIAVFRPQAVCLGSETRAENQLYSDFIHLYNIEIHNELSRAPVSLAAPKGVTHEERERAVRVTKLRQQHARRIRRGQLKPPKKTLEELALRVHDIYRHYKKISPMCSPLICDCFQSLIGFKADQLSKLVTDNRAKYKTVLSVAGIQSCYCCNNCYRELGEALSKLFQDSAAQYHALVRVYSCLIVTCLLVEQEGFDFCKYRYFCNHRRAMEKAYDVRYLPIVGLLRKLHALRSYEVLIGIEEFIDLYCIVLTSGFEWQHLDSPWNGVGTAFDPLIAATNHSCDPNTTIIDYDIAVRKDLPCNQACDRCMGHVVVLRALRRIRVGDQITISYSSARLARHLRRDTLKSMYYFDCRCQACRATDAIEEASFCPNCNRPFSLVAQRFKTVMNNGSEELDLGVVEQVWPTMLVDPSEGTNGYLREVASLGLDFLKQPPELAAGAVIDIDDESELSEVEKRLVETVTDPIVNCPRCKFACDWRAGELSAMAFQELLTRLMNNAAADEEDEPMTPDQRRAFEQELSEGFQRVLTQNNSYFFGRNITKRVADRLQAASQHAWYNGSCKDAQKAVLLSIFVVNEVEGVQALKRAEIDIEITGSRYDWLPICPSFTLSLYFGIFRVLDYLSWLDMFMQSQNGNLPTISAMAGFPSMAEFLRFNRIIVRLVHMWYAFVKKYEALSIEANHLRASYGLNDRHIAVISIRLARFGLEPDKNTPVEAIAQYLFDLTVESFGAEPSERICNLLTWRIISAVNEL